jgi:YgiT-type zinc finger domain-containing protein
MTTTIHKQSQSHCPQCKTGTLEAEPTQFSVDRGDKAMLIGNVPAMVCGKCLHKVFDQTLTDELTFKTHTLFAKSSGRMFCYQFSDLVRGDRPVKQLELFDKVRIKDDVNTWDLYDEQLLPGMEGTVLEKGMNPFDYVVEFKIGKGRRSNVLQIEIDEQDLELQP